MKPVQSALKKWIQDNQRFKEQYTKIKRKVLDDPEIKEFLQSHPELGEEKIEKNLIKLYEYKTQSKQCERCSSLGTSRNILQGYSPVLSEKNNYIYLAHEKCPKCFAKE